MKKFQKFINIFFSFFCAIIYWLFMPLKIYLQHFHVLSLAVQKYVSPLTVSNIIWITSTLAKILIAVKFVRKVSRQRTRSLSICSLIHKRKPIVLNAIFVVISSRLRRHLSDIWRTMKRKHLTTLVIIVERNRQMPMHSLSTLSMFMRPKGIINAAFAIRASNECELKSIMRPPFIQCRNSTRANFAGNLCKLKIFTIVFKFLIIFSYFSKNSTHMLAHRKKAHPDVYEKPHYMRDISEFEVKQDQSE